MWPHSYLFPSFLSFTKVMYFTVYSKIWLNLTFAAPSLTFIRGHKAFPVFHADGVIIGLPCGQGQLSRIWKVQCDWLSVGKECFCWAGVCGEGRNMSSPKNTCMGGYVHTIAARFLCQHEKLSCIVGWISNRMGTSVDDGARRSNNWLHQWQSGKLGTGSRV